MRGMDFKKKKKERKKRRKFVETTLLEMALRRVFDKIPKTKYICKNFSSINSIAFPLKEKYEGNYETLQLSKNETAGVYELAFNRIDKGNSFSLKQWAEFDMVFDESEVLKDLRCVILKGNGRHFTTGMDLSVFQQIDNLYNNEPCEGRKREAMNKVLKYFQKIISRPENLQVPVIAAIHGACIGAGVDLISACDLRYCTKDAFFCIKETDLGMVADLGTLQRIHHLIGVSKTLELTYTADTIDGREAKRIGLVTECFDTKEELNEYVNKLALKIASKSPLTIRGIKKSVLYSRDHDTTDSLNQIALWNSATLKSDDLDEAFKSMMTKSKPEFKN